MANFQSTASVPQGFSVYQPMLGAPLQFLPALGTKQLDDLMDAYFPGPASIKEKRATISLDFLDHIQRTGETFKFYAVTGSVASPESPASASASSLNVSPVTSNWDWSSISGPSAESSRTTSGRASRNASTASSRQQPTGDFSHMPGMKIMTKEGLDVTNSASRGSKTKEQRDHAHLMRIIKACESCRKKKVRCDPSHKKRGAASPVSASPAAKVVKKTKAARQEAPIAKSLPMAMESLPPPAPSIDFDFSLTSDLDTFMPLDLTEQQPWEDFIQYPVEDLDDNYDFFFDPEGYISSESATFSTPDSQSVCKSISPSSAHEHIVSGREESYAGTDYYNVGQLEMNATPAPDFNIPINTDYTDFNLFSPQSTFSEDDRMLSVASSTPSISSGETPDSSSQQRYPGATPSPLTDGSDGGSLGAYGTLVAPGEVEQPVIGGGQNHKRLLHSPSIDEGTADYLLSDYFDASGQQDMTEAFANRDGHTVSQSQSEQDTYAASLSSVSFVDSFGSDILATPELSESVSSLSSNRASQSPASTDLQGSAFTGVASEDESLEITSPVAASERRRILQQVTYTGDQQIVGDDQHAIMRAVFATQKRSRATSPHDQSLGSAEHIQAQLLQVGAGANKLRSNVTPTASADGIIGQSSIHKPRVLLSTGPGLSGSSSLSESKLLTSTSAPLSSDSIAVIGFYSLAVLMAQIVPSWNLFVALAIASAVVASYMGQWVCVKHNYGRQTLMSTRSLLSSVSIGHVSISTIKYTSRRVPLLGRQLLQAL